MTFPMMMIRAMSLIDLKLEATTQNRVYNFFSSNTLSQKTTYTKKVEPDDKNAVIIETWCKMLLLLSVTINTQCSPMF